MRPQELSFLVIFDAIMTEGSITRAAARLSMTQPAVSNAVSRMRSRWKDDLFVRDGRQIHPTSFAVSLWQQIRDPLRDLGEAITPETFDPATAKRTFRVCAVADAVVDATWCALRHIIESEAPGVNIHTFPYHLDETERILVNAEVDLIVGIAPPVDSVICTEHLYVPRHVCVMRHGHPLTRNPLTLAAFSAADHVLVSSMSCETTDATDRALARHGLRRRIAMTVHHFGLVPRVIADSDLIAVVPSTAIEHAIFAGDIAVYDPPVTIDPLAVASLWHKRRELEPGLVWLRAHVNRLMSGHAQAHAAELERRCFAARKLNAAR